MGYIGKVQIDSTAYRLGSTLYGVCDSAVDTYIKNVTLSDMNILIPGVTIHVKFTNGNSAPISSGANHMAIKFNSADNNTAINVSNPGGSINWSAGAVISFTLDGTTAEDYVWIVNDSDSGQQVTIENTYSATSENAISGKGVASAFGNLANKDVVTDLGSNKTSTDLPTAQAVATYVDNLLGANDAMVFKGTIGAAADNPTITSVPNGKSNNSTAPVDQTYQAGWTYRVITAGTYAGQTCEVGDLLIAIADSTSGQTAINNAHWTVAQTNIDSGMYRGTNTFTSGHFLMADGTAGKVKDGGTIGDGLTWVDSTNSIGIKVKLSSYTALSSGGTQDYSVALDGSGNLAVRVPWTDTKVTQTSISTNAEYPILLKYSSGTATTEITNTVNYKSGVTINPSTGTITASAFKGTLQASDVKAALSTGTSSAAVFLHKSGDWKTISLSDTIASVSNGVLTIKNVGITFSTPA